MVDKDKVSAEIHPSRGGGKDIGGVVRFPDHEGGKLDKDLLKGADNPDQTVTLSVIKNLNDLNRDTRYYMRIRMIHHAEAIRMFNFYLSGTIAVGGHQRDEALMANAGLWVPEGGRKMDKKQMNKWLDNQASQRSDRVNRNNGGNNNGGGGDE